MPLCSTPIRSRWNGQRIYRAGFSSNFSCSTFDFSTFDFLVQFLVLYFRFSRAISRALLSIFPCNFSCSTFDFPVQNLVLYFRFSRAVSRALLSIFSCNFSCPTFDFLVQFLWCDCYRDISPKKMKHKKNKKLCQSVPGCFKTNQNQLKLLHLILSPANSSTVHCMCHVVAGACEA